MRSSGLVTAVDYQAESISYTTYQLIRTASSFFNWSGASPRLYVQPVYSCQRSTLVRPASEMRAHSATAASMACVTVYKFNANGIVVRC